MYLSKIFLLIFVDVIFDILIDACLIVLSNFNISFNFFWMIFIVIIFLIILLLTTFFIKRNKGKYDYVIPVLSIVFVICYMFINEFGWVYYLIDGKNLPKVIEPASYTYMLWILRSIVIAFYIYILGKERVNLKMKFK